MDRQSGAVAVEYAVLVGLIAVVIIGAAGVLGMAILPEERVDRIVRILDGEDPSQLDPPPPLDCKPWPGGGESKPPPDAGFC
jgi:hypothetical protein